jgi:hypothetical protein
MTTPSQHLSPPPPLQDIPLSHEASKSSTAADVLKEDRCNASSACIQGHNPGSRVSRHVLGTDRLNCLLQVSCNCLLQLFVTGFPHQYAHTHTRAIKQAACVFLMCTTPSPRGEPQERNSGVREILALFHFYINFYSYIGALVDLRYSVSKSLTSKRDLLEK